MDSYSFSPIGIIRSCFVEKFGIPRQPGLISGAEARLNITGPFAQPAAFRGLEAFSHIWVVFVFHANDRDKWKPTIRPPRLGGNRKIGVFASRSGFRPNAIGQSVVSLLGIDFRRGVVELRLGGVDLMDGTPVLDIKPYLPYADSLPQAQAGWAAEAPRPKFDICFSAEAIATCDLLDPCRYPGLKGLIEAVLAQDPRPAYKEAVGSSTFGMTLWDLNIRFTVSGQGIMVDRIDVRPESAAYPPDSYHQGA